ncbi:hypothetical protein JL720_4152 [Aureococcus anophagefferens]|nr:hypothetical protein JL720_4152 [Aureococcus anophagefferens]
MRSARALAWLVAWSLTHCAAPFSAVAPRAAELRFDHVQIFADEVAPVADYKRLEAEAAALGARLDAGEALPAGDAFDGLNRDVVRQLVCALQWRVAASCEARDTQAAEAALDAVRAAGAVDAAGLVDLELDAARAAMLVGDGAVAAAVAESRYANLKDMLGDEFDEAGYVAIVRANVLVDAQGDDVLLQIFTQPVLRRAPGEEAPFLEFIQRVCAMRDVPPAGCGGFGIRNFLVLFLSIELNAAADALARAATPPAAANAAARLDCLRRQLAASNPILAAISDAAAAEADGLAAGDETAVDAARRRKDGGQRELQAVSAAFADEMRAIREDGA